MEALEPDSKLLLFFYLIDLVYRCELLSKQNLFQHYIEPGKTSAL